VRINSDGDVDAEFEIEVTGRVSFVAGDFFL
jgi:hypothetical protein